MNGDKESVISLIQKCLNLAQSPNEHEAAAAAAKAQELLFKYNLSMIEVEGHKEKGKGPRLIELDGDITTRKNWGRWKGRLAHSVARYNFCDGFQDPYHGRYVFIGEVNNAQAAREIYNWLVVQVEAASVTACFNYRGPSRIPTFRRSFFTGAVVTINNRLYKRWTELRGETDQSTALVLNVRAQLEAYKAERHPDLVKRSIRMSNGSYQGYLEGLRAGREVDIEARRKLEDKEAYMLE